jgi:hypothetical protein
MSYKLKSILLLCCSAYFNNSHAQTLLTDYGSGDTQAFTLSVVSSTFNQGATTGTFTGSSFGELLRGTFNPVNLTSMGTPGSLELNLTFNTTYSGSIDYIIGSSAGNVIGYSYAASSISGPSTIRFLRNASLDSGTVILSSINRAALTADSPNFTLNTLTAIAASSPIPEPSTYAALFGAAALGMAACRRRRPAA